MKKIFIILISALLITTTSLAKINSTEKINNKSHAHSIAPKWVCHHCGHMAVEICDGKISYYGKGTHKYDWFSKTCTYVSYTCYARYYCPDCQITLKVTGPHLCAEAHGHCDKGWYNICPIN